MLENRLRFFLGFFLCKFIQPCCFVIFCILMISSPKFTRKRPKNDSFDEIEKKSEKDKKKFFSRNLPIWKIAQRLLLVFPQTGYSDIIALLRVLCSPTLDSGINPGVCLLILGLFSSGCMLIKGGMFINFLFFKYFYFLSLAM